ncbi:hypothetical protein AAVH_38195 [Aphelenchoides avenae]|nr:hypothetical protein AAVH_38195 [Aphelenchus avenae]
MTVVLPILVTTIYSAIALDTVAQTWDNAIVSLVVIVLGFVVYYVFVWDKALPRYASYREWTANVNRNLCVFAQVVLNGMVHTDEHAPEETKRQPVRNYGSFSETHRSGNGISNGH